MGYWKRINKTKNCTSVSLRVPLFCMVCRDRILNHCFIVCLCKSLWSTPSTPRIIRDICWVHITYQFTFSSINTFCVYGQCMSFQTRANVPKMGSCWPTHFWKTKVLFKKALKVYLQDYQKHRIDLVRLGETCFFFWLFSWLKKILIS